MCPGEADGSSSEEESIHANDVRKRRQDDRRLSLDGSTASSSCESSELVIAHPETKKDGTENCTSGSKNYNLAILDNNKVLWSSMILLFGLLHVSLFVHVNWKSWI